MAAQSSPSEAPRTDDAAIRAVCRQPWEAWNNRSSEPFAAAFVEDGEVIGFDGSEMHGRSEIESQLGQIFGNHPTARYVGKVRGVRLLASDVAVLRAIVGMVPPGGSDINPAVNALQVFVMAKRDGQWRIVSMQNTPAQFHGRPELAQQMTDELRQLL